MCTMLSKKSSCSLSHLVMSFSFTPDKIMNVLIQTYELHHFDEIGNVAHKSKADVKCDR